MNGFKIALCLLFFSISLPANSALIIDQNQPLANSVPISFTGVAQSFQQTASNVAGAGIFLAGTGTGNVSISLYNYGNTPFIGGALLASASGIATGGGSWFDVFWNPVAVTPGSTLFLLFNRIDFNNTLVINSALNPYPLGVAYANAYGTTPYDFTFRTYSSTAVPVPGSIALLTLGLVGMLYLRKRAAV